MCLSNGSNLSSKALADGLDDGIVLNVVRVVGLQLGGNAGEGTLESLLGRSVDHLGLDASVIGRPSNEGDLVSASRPLASFTNSESRGLIVPHTIARGEVVLEVVDGVAGTLALAAGLVLGSGVDKLLTEGLPVLVCGCLLNNNLLEVVGELVDDVLVLLAELQVIVGGDALLRDGCSRLRHLCYVYMRGSGDVAGEESRLGEKARNRFVMYERRNGEL
jgi:hypothetical protein